jgi:hypothetical protein
VVLEGKEGAKGGPRRRGTTSDGGRQEKPTLAHKRQSVLIKILVKFKVFFRIKK